jgi:hypothetical protein
MQGSIVAICLILGIQQPGGQPPAVLAPPTASQSPAGQEPTLLPQETATAPDEGTGESPSAAPPAEPPPANVEPPSAATAGPSARSPGDEPGLLDSGAGGERLVPVERKGRSRLSDMLYEALAAAAGGLDGRSVTLAEALARAVDPRARIDVVRAYWQLACAMLDFEFRRAELGTLDRLASQDASDQSTAELIAAQAAARARREEAQIRVIEAQQRLGGLVSGTAPPPLLLASDPPHAGAYRTKFELLFAGRSAPPQAWLLNRILPLREQEVAARGRAAEAAAQAVAASEAAYAQDHGKLSQLLADLSLLASVRRTLVQSLRQYNEEIADFALGAITPPNDPGSVAAMLIKPPATRAAAAGAASPASGVERAGFEDGQPNARPAPPASNPGTNQGASTRHGIEGTAPAPGTGQGDLTREQFSQLLANTQLYQGLVGMETNKQTQRLVKSLFQQAPFEAAGATVTLLDVLQNANAAGNRLDAIRGFWRTRELAAREHVLDDVMVQIEAIEALTEMVDAHPDAAAALVLHGAAASARADLVATQIARLVAQWQLTLALGGHLDQPWLAPVTTPHGGRYRPKAESAGTEAPANEPAQWIGQLHGLLTTQAAAVVELDRSRADQLANYVAHGGDVRKVLLAIGEGTEQTLALLSTVTRYNQQIAQYALSVLPAGTPAESLMAAMVTNRSASGDGSG